MESSSAPFAPLFFDLNVHLLGFLDLLLNLVDF